MLRAEINKLITVVDRDYHYYEKVITVGFGNWW